MLQLKGKVAVVTLSAACRFPPAGSRCHDGGGAPGGALRRLEGILARVEALLGKREPMPPIRRSRDPPGVPLGARRGRGGGSS